MSDKLYASSDTDRSPLHWKFAGRSILITGGSGFMGKVLIEKLLRSCSDLSTIFLLLRSKTGKTLDERVTHFTSGRLYDRLRAEQPHALRKLRAISGDVSELGLGLSDGDRRLLQTEVSVIFHAAASVRFDDSLRDALLTNVRGTRELLELAKQMPRLEAFLHLSTIYCNCNQAVVAEEIYPAPGSWEKMIRLVKQNRNEALINALTPKVISSLPNTYTYAKALSEQLLKEYGDKLPLVIVRPSIVTLTATEPIPAWTSSLNGPMGLWVGTYTGVIRVLYADADMKLDCVPADSSIKSMIFFAWHRAVIQPRHLDDMPVYNCCTLTEPISHRQMFRRCEGVLKENPTMKSLWYPLSEWSITANYLYYYVSVIFCHMLPALILDSMMTAVGRKPMFMKLYRRIFIANDMVSYFTTKEFKLSNLKFLETERFMLPGDREEFSYSKISVCDRSYITKGTILARELILKDPLSTMEAAKKRRQRSWPEGRIPPDLGLGAGQQQLRALRRIGSFCFSTDALCLLKAAKDTATTAYFLSLLIRYLLKRSITSTVFARNGKVWPLIAKENIGAPEGIEKLILVKK